MELTSEQIRAARAFLRWSQEDLASAAHVSASTIERLERGEKKRFVNISTIRTVLEAAGIEFLEGGGVRLRPAKQPSNA